MRSPTLRYPLPLTLLAAADRAAAALGLAAAAVEPARVAAAVWPDSGIALAAISLLGPRVRPAVWPAAPPASHMNALPRRTPRRWRPGR